jgi:hypothetical protein
MGGLSFPRVIAPSDLDLPPFQPWAAQLVADTLGNAGTPTDGFDVTLNDAADAMANADAVLTALDGDVAEAGTIAAEADQVWEQDAASTLADTVTQAQPDFDLIGADLLGNPPPNAPPVTQTRDPVSAADFPGVLCALIDAVPNIKVGAAPQTTRLSVPVAEETQPGAIAASLETGDPEIWSISVFPDPPGGKHGIEPAFEYWLEATINPVRAGKFRAVVKLIHTQSGAADDRICIGVTVTE